MTPTVHDYVKAYLMAMRAAPTERFVSTRAGSMTVRTSGERRILAPDGTSIRIVEHPESGNQIEHGDTLHAVVRPRTIRVKASMTDVQVVAECGAVVRPRTLALKGAIPDVH